MYAPVMWFIFITLAQLMEGGTNQVCKFKQGRQNFRLAVTLDKRCQVCEMAWNKLTNNFFVWTY